ncbi:MAG: CapA family protein [Bacteroidota bacterium]|jgi:poly-gamma-glutamate synthesis protein (capsule biosynthesis protein)
MKHFLLLLQVGLSFTTGAQDTTRISLLFAGDIMGHDSQIASAYNAATGQYDYTSCFAGMKPYIESADVAIGNLEVTLAGPPYKGYPQFSSPDALAVALRDVGFDVLVSANNHSVDRGRKGILRTIRVLDSLGIPHTGTFANEAARNNEYPLILNKNGFTLALLNYTYGTNGIPVPAPGMVNLIDTAQMRADIQKARQVNPDAIIVFMHWGNEYESLPTRGQRQLADHLCRLGADLVIGSHPHVLQPMEWRKDQNKLVVYSLGNFVSGQRKRYTDGGATVYTELMKIRYKPDSVITTIDSVGYFLQWVYRTEDEKRNYYMIPVPHAEKDIAAFRIKGATSQAAFKQFVADSRALYGKHNINVPEIAQIPPDSVVRFRIHVASTAPSNGGASVPALDEYHFYGIEPINDEFGTTLVIGNFSNAGSANVLCKKLIEAGHTARVVQYVGGRKRILRNRPED